MQRLVLLMIVVATTFEYLAKGDRWGRFSILPNEAAYLGELLGGVALLYVVGAGTHNRFQYVRPAYWFIFGALVFTMLAGIVLNSVQAGPIFAGLRTYLRAIPWFFIGAVVAITEPEIRRQLRLLLAVALIQLPIAIEQRMRGFGGSLGYVSYTGDATTGTFLISSVLSVFLVCCLCILVAFYVRRKLSAGKAGILFMALLAPATVNETKGTLILLPLGLIVTFLVAAKPGRRLKSFLIAGGVVLLSGVIFVPITDYFKKPSNPGVIELYADEEELQQHLSKGVELGSISDKPAGRLDSVVAPLQALSSDPATFMFGYGVGNASDSVLGIHYVGEHYQRFQFFMTIGFTRITLELGVFGLVLVLLVMWSIFRDAVHVARRDDGLLGAISAGMSGAIAVVVLSMVYKDLIGQMSMSFLFWYFAGLVAAQRMRLAAASRR